MLKKNSFKFNLIMMFLGIGVVPMLLAMFVAYYQASSEIESQSHSRLELLSNAKTQLISSYFDKEIEAMKDMVSSPLITKAMADFTSSFKSFQNLTLNQQGSLDLKKFYEKSFQNKYKEINGQNAQNIESFFESLPEYVKAAQYDYIIKTNTADMRLAKEPKATKTVYHDTHNQYHAYLESHLNRHGLYDIFLIDPDGNVVYSVYKEIDFATNLIKGPLSNSGLANAFKSSIGNKQYQIHTEDFAAYFPSFDAPAGFFSTPIISENGKAIGSLVFQAPLDRITAIMSNRDGFGEKGQGLLFGQDSKLRADAFRDKDRHNVRNSFASNAKPYDSYEPIALAFKNGKGTISTTSIDGSKVVAYYQLIDIGNKKWAVISELSEEELYQGLVAMSYKFWTIIAISLISVFAISWVVSSSITHRLSAITKTLSLSTQSISSASASADESARTLASSATEQAASLQETMASAEQISAMIAQNAESAVKAKETVDANAHLIESGGNSVALMGRAIEDIRDTNASILLQMEASNQEFGRIVRIITEIGDKTKVINDIVFQTKLLSFNASVEAARAGEHGKGFAVVAEEVGNLAQMSGTAAKQISDLLTTSIQNVNAIVEDTKVKVNNLIEAGQSKILMGQATAEECKGAFDKLSDNAKKLTLMVTEIAHASKEQAQGIREINTAISQLDEVTQNTSQVSQVSSSQAEELLRETAILTGAVTDIRDFLHGNGRGDNQQPKDQVRKREPAAINSKPSPKPTPSKTEAKNKVSKHIVPITKNSKPAKDPANPSQLKSEKIAVGSDIAPKNDHPDFENF